MRSVHALKQRVFFRGRPFAPFAQSVNTLRWYMYLVLVSSPTLPSYSSVVATCRATACMSKRGDRTEHW